MRRRRRSRRRRTSSFRFVASPFVLISRGGHLPRDAISLQALDRIDAHTLSGLAILRQDVRRRFPGSPDPCPRRSRNLAYDARLACASARRLDAFNWTECIERSAESKYDDRKRAREKNEQVGESAYSTR